MTNCFIALGTIGVLLLLWAVGVCFWRFWRYHRDARDLEAGGVHVGAFGGARVESPPQYDGIAEERERDVGRRSRWAHASEPDYGIPELGVPPRAYML